MCECVEENVCACVYTRSFSSKLSAFRSVCVGGVEQKHSLIRRVQRVQRRRLGRVTAAGQMHHHLLIQDTPRTLERGEMEREGEIK